LSSAIRHPAFVICHPAFVICHFSFPIPRSEFRIPHFQEHGVRAISFGYLKLGLTPPASHEKLGRQPV
jgi:hypothetical protein